MKISRQARIIGLVAIIVVAGARSAEANCVEPGGFAIRQCADLAFFAAVPDPNFTLVFGDPNRPTRVSNIAAAFWQVGFGNRLLNTGLGSDGTGNSGATTFNGNDHGNFVIDLRDARAATGNPGGTVPVGATCLGTNNWGSAGVDGCCDDVRVAFSPLSSDDGLLNPYYDVYSARFLSTPGYYSLAGQQDYPMAVLLKTEPAENFFAFAAVATVSRGNTGSMANGPCHPTDAGNNPAPCDTSEGLYRFADVVNGVANPADLGSTNVVPWQATPAPIVTSARRLVITDPNSEIRVDFHWDEVEIHSDQSIRPSANSTLAPGNFAFAAGVGVSDIATKFGLVRYLIEVAPAGDPSFSSPTQSLEATSSPSHVTIPGGSCIRIRTLFGKKPQTGSNDRSDCRVGKCGDVGYEIASPRVCPVAGLCVPTGAEVCDDLDNDCDGTVDAFASSCGLGACASTGFCSAGIDTCAAGTPSPETCNNVDDNCDGTVDGFATICGVGGCVAAGTCTGGFDNCAPKAPSTEICDGIDNNCNGTVDEGSPGSGAPCSTGQQGVCAAGTTACSLGSLTCVRNIDPLPESCDGVDNDCNGAVDNGNPGGGAGCSTGKIGACAAGTTQCQGGSVKCVQNNQPSTDLCDGIDNDCDGQVDEDFVPGPDTCGVGACASTGIGTCTAGVPGSTCVPGPSSTEICDGVDNDCNGVVDNGNPGGGAACGTGQPGVCAAGTQTCLAGSFQCVRNVPPSAEICNNLDDNCDGTVDSFATLCGLGACAAAGTCTAGVNTCTAGTPAPNDASCNGIDDDCNGQTDEDFVQTPTACGVGACARAGQTTCANGIQGNTCTPGAPAVNDATCNGIDDDCNGQSDEDFVPTPTACGVGACASTGTTTCAIGTPGNTCTPGNPTTEVCDGLDNDCNGVADNGNPGGGAACGTGQPGVCAAGTQTCLAGSLQCMRNVPPSTETCNNLDDNCDGTVDGFATTCGIGACASAGTCTAGTNTCTAGIPAANDASCNDIDDDCNGQKDEDFVQMQTACGVGACMSLGTTTCVLGVPGNTCVPGAPAANDATCNGLDDDCSGLSDEDFVQAPTACGVGACAATGTTTCAMGTPGNSCTPGNPTTEVCDGLDNDCNGVVDNVAGGCGFVVLSPTAGQSLDCSTPTPPTITWDRDTYDGFRVFVSWDPNLAGKKKVSSGSALLQSTSYTVPAKKWLRACANGAQGLYIAVFGVDRDLPKGDPLRKVYTPIVAVSSH